MGGKRRENLIQQAHVLGRHVNSRNIRFIIYDVLIIFQELFIRVYVCCSMHIPQRSIRQSRMLYDRNSDLNISAPDRLEEDKR